MTGHRQQTWIKPPTGLARRLHKFAIAVLLATAALAVPARAMPAAPPVYRIDHFTDGDTVVLRNGQRVRLVQIDTPEVFFGAECYGPNASATTKQLLPPGTRVRLLLEPATNRVDAYGRLLRYVIRASDGLNVNVRLVAVGAAAPYFFRGGAAGSRRGSSCSRRGRERTSVACGARVRGRRTTRTERSRRHGSRPGLEHSSLGRMSRRWRLDQ
jgi:endonuclease YncB( thermonuclease family)